ncbi:hypothetical protein LJC42_00270 [Eubacteriales bacterium OttesenSCG-928-K08]|nr:hypothetical protein [Eubacteriales bacterium OttesenSCG-928-K08]
MEKHKMNLQLFAEGDPAAINPPAQPAPAPDGAGNQPDNGDGSQQPPENVTLTQEQLDDLIDKAFAKGARKGARDAKKSPAAPATATQAPPPAQAQAQEPTPAPAYDQNLIRARERIVDAAILAAASGLGFLDPSDAIALVDRSDIDMDDDFNVDGATEAVEALAKLKPHLRSKKEAPPVSGGMTGQATKPEQKNYGAECAKRKQEQQKKSLEALNKL